MKIMIQTFRKVRIVIININSQPIQNMDIIMNMLSLAKDVNSTEKQLKKLNLEIKYELQKAQKLSKSVREYIQTDSFILENLILKMNEAEKFSAKFTELLNSQRLGIKDKIVFNLPFDQTKKQANSVLEDLRKAIGDVKQWRNQQYDGDLPVKRKIKEDNNLSSPLNSQNQPSDEKKVQEKLEQIYEMGPTIKQDQIIFSQQNKQILVQFTISLNGNNEMIQTLRKCAPNLVETKKTINFSEKLQEQILYTIARANYKTVYPKIKAHTKQIDGISTKGHFHFILKKLEDQNMPTSNAKHRQSNKSQTSQLHRISSKQRGQQQQFFSFPEQNIDIYNSFKIFTRKFDKTKNLYIYRQQKWLKVQEEQFEVINGDKVAAYYNEKQQNPSIYYQINYRLVDK